VLESAGQAANAMELEQSEHPSATTQLEQMLATFMTAMQQSNAQLKESI
jgi:hypothetical protein